MGEDIGLFVLQCENLHRKKLLNQEDFWQILKITIWPLYYFSEFSTNDCYTQQLHWSKQPEIWGNQDIGTEQPNTISNCVSEQCCARLYQ